MVTTILWVTTFWPAIGRAGQGSDIEYAEGSTCTADG